MKQGSSEDDQRAVSRKLQRERESGSPEDRRFRQLEARLQKTIARALRQDVINGFREEAEFLRVATPVLEDLRTSLGPERLYVLWQAIRNVTHLQLAAAEVGSFRGGSAHFIASAFVALAGNEVEFHIFDTFEGHPEGAVGEYDEGQRVGGFGATTAGSVRRYLSTFTRISIHAGDVSTQLGTLAEKTYSFIHLDTDLYKPTLDSLEYFGKRLAGGGMIVVDDYSARKCPGIRRAVEEYAPDLAEFITWQPRTEQFVLIKR